MDKKVASATKAVATVFPETIYIRHEDDDDGGYFVAETTTEEADDGELVGVYTLQVVKTKSVAHALKD